MDKLTELSRADLIKNIRVLKRKLLLLEYKRKRNIDVLTRRVKRKDAEIKKQKGIIFTLDRRLYGQKLKTSMTKTQAKKEGYEEAVNNIVNKQKYIMDMSRYHISILELADVFGESPTTIVVLLWSGRYEFYSKKEFNANFPDSPFNFVKYNMVLCKRGLANKWEQKRNYYYLSSSGKDMINRINKYIEKRMNG